MEGKGDMNNEELRRPVAVDEEKAGSLSSVKRRLFGRSFQCVLLKRRRDPNPLALLEYLTDLSFLLVPCLPLFCIDAVAVSWYGLKRDGKSWCPMR